MTDARSYYRPFVVPSAPQVRSERRQRRSKRLKLTVSVIVHGKGMSGEPFREATRMLSVNAYGGLLALTHTVQEGQMILVQNRYTGQEQECRIANLSVPQAGKWGVGIEFTQARLDFWKIYFPPLAPTQ